MPMFEFVCAECGHSFEELLRNTDAVSSLVCPKCGSPNVRKKLSTFASRISGVASFSLGGSSSSCNTGSA